MPTLKTAPVDRKAAEHLLNELFKHFNAFWNPAHTPSHNELEKYFTPHFSVINNDKPVIHNFNDLLTKIREFQNEYSHTHFEKQQDSIILDGNKLAVRYNIDLTSKSGKKIQYQASANLTMENGKIAKIEQVLHEKGNSNLNY